MSSPYYSRLAALAAEATAAPADQLPKLRKLLETVLRDDCKAREVPFIDLNQAIGQVAYAHELPVALRQQLQALRLAANLVLHESYPGTPVEAARGFATVAGLLLHLTGTAYAGPPLPVAAEKVVEAAEAAPAAAEAAPMSGGQAALAAGPAVSSAAARAVWRVRVLHADLATGVLTVEIAVPAVGRPVGPFGLLLPPAYESVLPLAAVLHPTLNLIGPVLLADGRVRARRVVLEPDYLISVTTVAECAQKDGTIPEWALLNAFLPDETSRPLVLGNLVNLLLDEEVSHAGRQEELRIKTEETAQQQQRARLERLTKRADPAAEAPGSQIIPSDVSVNPSEEAKKMIGASNGLFESSTDAVESLASAAAEAAGEAAAVGEAPAAAAVPSLHF